MPGSTQYVDSEHEGQAAQKEQGGEADLTSSILSSFDLLIILDIRRPEALEEVKIQGSAQGVTSAPTFEPQIRDLAR